MIHIIPMVNLWTIFGHTTNSDNFWTEICLTSRTSDGLGQIFFLKLAPLIDTLHQHHTSWIDISMCAFMQVYERKLICGHATLKLIYSLPTVHRPKGVVF